VCGFHNKSSDLTHLNRGFLADFEQRIISGAINQWQNDCGAVNAERRHLNTCCNC